MATLAGLVKKPGPLTLAPDPNPNPNPLQVAQTLLRTQSTAQGEEAGSDRYRGVLDCLRRLLAEEGVPGLSRRR